MSVNHATCASFKVLYAFIICVVVTSTYDSARTLSAVILSTATDDCTCASDVDIIVVPTMATTAKTIITTARAAPRLFLNMFFIICSFSIPCRRLFQSAGLVSACGFNRGDFFRRLRGWRREFAYAERVVFACVGGWSDGGKPLVIVCEFFSLHEAVVK